MATELKSDGFYWAKIENDWTIVRIKGSEIQFFGMLILHQGTAWVSQNIVWGPQIEKYTELLTNDSQDPASAKSE